MKRIFFHSKVKYILCLLKNIFGLNIETHISDTVIQDAIAQINTLNYIIYLSQLQ